MLFLNLMQHWAVVQPPWLLTPVLRFTPTCLITAQLSSPNTQCHSHLLQEPSFLAFSSFARLICNNLGTVRMLCSLLLAQTQHGVREGQGGKHSVRYLQVLVTEAWSTAATPTQVDTYRSMADTRQSGFEPQKVKS